MILLTGASGFVGRHVLAQLCDQPLRLLVLPNDPILPELQERFQVVTGDVTILESLSLALEGVKQVVHLAGYVNGGRGSVETFMTINAQGTANLARAAKAARVVHFIYISSITVYGSVQNAKEAAPFVRSPGYPTSKITAEKSLRQLLPEQATILRLPLVLGAGDTGFMCPAIDAFRQTRKVIIIGTGKAPWSVLAATDAARAISLCLAKPETQGSTYNVLGETITNGELLRSLGVAAGCRREIRLPYAVAWIMALFAEVTGRDNLTRAQVRALGHPLSMNGDSFAKVGFVSKTSWREALTQAVTWCAERSER